MAMPSSGCSSSMPVLFVILKFIFVIYLLSDANMPAYFTNVYNWFVVPSSGNTLAYRPWTAFTYMFADSELFRFVSNIFWLWSFGYILQDLTGNRKLIPIYLFGGLTGAGLFVVSHYIFPAMHIPAGSDVLAGANCAIVAIAVATTAVSPDYRIFPMINGGIPLWILTIIYLLINFSSITRGDASVYFANLGAAGTGFLFIYQMRRGHDWSAWINSFFRLDHGSVQSRQAKEKYGEERRILL